MLLLPLAIAAVAVVAAVHSVEDWDMVLLVSFFIDVGNVIGGDVVITLALAALILRVVTGYQLGQKRYG